MVQKNFFRILFSLIFVGSLFSLSAQTKPRKTAAKSAKKAVQTKPEIVAEKPVQIEPKKNSRPEEQTEVQSEPIKKNAQSEKTNARPADALKANPSIYFYEFSQPNFTVSKILIEHDENGKGQIKFSKQNFEELISDPIQLSPAALERIKTAWQTLNFLDSTENYQYEKDYAHLGNMTFAMRKDGRERTAKFNWTTNKDAKNLADEYRRIASQFVWIFDIGVARANQPLEAPQLIDALDALIKRNEISDAAQMLPLLKELGNDERIPLIARNHAARIIKEIEKKKEDKK